MVEEIWNQVIYLSQGKLYPDFVGVELGIAEKLAMKAVAKATGISERSIEDDLRETGDLGQTAQKFLETRRQVTFISQPLTVERVFETLDKIAKTSGSGSTDQKISLLVGLLMDAEPKEAKYIVRTVTGKLRLGIADMTVLDALAVAYGAGKDSRSFLERAYNVSSDLGKVAMTIVEAGVEGLEKFQVSIGAPASDRCWPGACSRLMRFLKGSVASVWLNTNMMESEYRLTRMETKSLFFQEGLRT